MHEGSLISTSLPTLVISCLFDNSHCDKCEVNLFGVLTSISLMIGDTQHLFMCLLAICMSYLEKSLAYFFFFLAYFLIRLFSVVVELYELFIYLGY